MIEDSSQRLQLTGTLEITGIEFSSLGTKLPIQRGRGWHKAIKACVRIPKF